MANTRLIPQMKALVGDEAGGYRLADNIDIPHPKPGTVLCRVYAVAVSPYDAEIVDYSNIPGAFGGCDFTWVVVKVGEGLTRFKVGYRVLAVTIGLNATDKTAGAFAEYAFATKDLACHVPKDLSLIQASSMGLAVATAGLALFQAPRLQLTMPRVPNWRIKTRQLLFLSQGVRRIAEPWQFSS